MDVTTLGGEAEIAINGITIPSSLLSEITPEFTEGTRERSTLAGTFTKPSGVYETAQISFTMFLPNYDYLKAIFPGKYNAPTGTVESGNFGNFIFGSNSCVTTEAVPVNVHYKCEPNDDNDLHIFAGIAGLNFNPTYNGTDDLTVEVTIFAQPTEDGLFRIGTGNLLAESKYNAATSTTVAV